MNTCLLQIIRRPVYQRQTRLQLLNKVQSIFVQAEKVLESKIQLNPDIYEAQVWEVVVQTTLISLGLDSGSFNDDQCQYDEVNTHIALSLIPDLNPITKKLNDHEEILADCKQAFAANKRLIHCVCLVALHLNSFKTELLSELITLGHTSRYQQAWQEDQELEFAMSEG